MTQEHPIPLPSRELVDQWRREYFSDTYTGPLDGVDIYVAQQAACWGADQELEACVEWLGDAPVVWKNDEELHPGSYLRDARRPKSLKQQALSQLQAMEQAGALDCNIDAIRRALETITDTKTRVIKMEELYHKFLMEALANLTEEIKILKAEVKELKERDHHYAPPSGWRRDRPNKLK